MPQGDVVISATFKEKLLAGLNETATAGLQVYTHNRSIIIENALAPITVYNLTSGVIGSTHNAANTVRIPVPQAGVYVVRVGSEVRKAVVK